MSARWTLDDLAEYESRRMKQKPQKGNVAGAPKRTQQLEPAPSKYKNKKVEIDGIKFDSKKEAARYQELKSLERAGAIYDLRLQVPFVFALNDVRICKYIADFVYREKSIRGPEIVEDVKGKVTREYVIKRKMMRAFYAIEILET